MLFLIVVCVVVGLWLCVKESEDAKDSIEESNLDENQNEEDGNVDDIVISNNIIEDYAQQDESFHNIDEILKLKNKDFVFRCLYILSEKNRKEDVEKLTDVEFCKNRFNMYYAILQEVNLEINDERIFMDNCGHRRYYPDVITLFDKNYIVCNDWFYNNKTNTRDTRTPFVRWVVR